jgi:hypothetical protein
MLASLPSDFFLEAIAKPKTSVFKQVSAEAPFNE